MNLKDFKKMVVIKLKAGGTIKEKVNDITMSPEWISLLVSPSKVRVIPRETIAEATVEAIDEKKDADIEEEEKKE